MKLQEDTHPHYPVVWDASKRMWHNLTTGELIRPEEYREYMGRNRAKRAAEKARQVEEQSSSAASLNAPLPLEDHTFDPSYIRTYVIGHLKFEQNLFKDRGFPIVHELDKADMVVWTGGSDISPELYGENRMTYVHSTIPSRDAEEIRYYRQTYGKFRAGICRGGQLLNVLNGGKLWQHVEGHNRGSHMMTDVLTGRGVMTSSVHHQAFRPTSEAEIVAISDVSTKKYAEGIVWSKFYPLLAKPDEISTDFEVVWYPDTRSLCFQGHPEYSSPPECSDYFFELIRRYYNAHPVKLEAA